MLKYEIYGSTVKIAYKNRAELMKGCSLGDECMSKMESFNTLSEAKKAFKEYKTDVRNCGNYFLVSEYSICEAKYKEDNEGEIIYDSIDTLEVSDMIFELVDKTKYTVVKTFNTYEEAEDALADYEDDIDLYYISCEGSEL